MNLIAISLCAFVIFDIDLVFVMVTPQHNTCILCGVTMRIDYKALIVIMVVRMLKLCLLCAWGKIVNVIHT